MENDEWIEEENANEYDVRCLLLQSARRHRRRGVSLFQTRYSFIHMPFCSSLFVLEKKRPTAGSDVYTIQIKTRTCKKSSTKRFFQERTEKPRKQPDLQPSKWENCVTSHAIKAVRRRRSMCWTAGHSLDIFSDMERTNTKIFSV